ncbi:hypothetical protein [Pseudoxanthomonas sp. 10H]|uniref:hypothetical protein n=1 Tax=Pseudoxanthomonas sp. 10H TaxID=3242729 RepID=UPI003555DA2F
MATKATKKTARGTTPARRGDVTTTPTHRPTLAGGPLRVTAQGATLKDDERLIVVVHVADQEGAPVAGLKKANFRLWQMGHHFSELGGCFVVEVAGIAGLEGTYQLVREPWSLVGNGTIPFIVRVQKGAARSGMAMTSIVKVREGLDL